MKNLILFILIIVMYFSNDYAQYQNIYSAQSVREDLKYLYQTLDKSHYNLYKNTPKEIFNKEFDNIYYSINDSLTLLQIDRLFHRFVALARDGHTNLPDPPISSYLQYLKNNGTLFPLNIYFENRRVYVLDNFSSDSSIIPGDEIVSINGKSMNDYLDDIYDYLCGDNKYSKASTIESFTFPRMNWIVKDEEKNFKIGIRKHDGSLINKNVLSVQAAKFEQRMAGKKPLLDQTRFFCFIDDVAYLKPGIFYSIKTNEQNHYKGSMTNNYNFIKYLDSCFTLIYKMNINKLIIDLRDNPGGSATFSNPMVAFIATKPFIINSNFFMRTSEISKKFWKEVNDTSELFTDIKKEVMSRQDGERFVISSNKYKYYPRKDTLKYNGKVYVLINRFTFSQAIEVAQIISSYNLGILIGEKTPPLKSANARQFILPNTRITVSFSEAYYDNISLSKGVCPDYIIHDDLLTEKDEILDFALNLMK
ncbi:MAG: S41 family peptidase [Calditrichaceae bacterium]